METKVTKGNNNTYEAIVSLTEQEKNKYLNDALEHEAKHIKIEGFREGKAPLNIVKEKVDKSSLRGHALNHIFTDVYSKLIKENKLNPIINPRFEIIRFEDVGDVELRIIIVEKPEIKIGNYKAELSKKYKSKLSDQSRLNDTPGNEPVRDTKVEKSSKKKVGSEKKDVTDNSTDTILTSQEIIETLLSCCDVDIAELLLNEEVDRMMASLIDQTAKMGITVDQYLTAVNKKPDQIREEYRKSALQNIKGDFIITEIARIEKIEVTDIEIDQTINAVPDEKSKEELKKPEQRIYIKAILTKSKTLEYLKEESKKVIIL